MTYFLKYLNFSFSVSFCVPLSLFLFHSPSCFRSLPLILSLSPSFTHILSHSPPPLCLSVYLSVTHSVFIYVPHSVSFFLFLYHGIIVFPSLSRSPLFLSLNRSHTLTWTLREIQSLLSHHVYHLLWQKDELSNSNKGHRNHFLRNIIYNGT